MSKYVGNLIPHTFFVTKGSGESDLELHAGSYHMALHDAGISDFNIMVYSSVLPATAHIASMDEIDLPPFGSELKTILAVSHGQQDEFVSAGVVYAWMYADENFDQKVGGLVCEVSGRYRIEELEARLIRVINDLHQKTYGHFYLGELNFVTEGITIEKRYGTALAGLCFIDFQLPEVEPVERHFYATSRSHLRLRDRSRTDIKATSFSIPRLVGLKLVAFLIVG